MKRFATAFVVVICAIVLTACGKPNAPYIKSKEVTSIDGSSTKTVTYSATIENPTDIAYDVYLYVKFTYDRAFRGPTDVKEQKSLKYTVGPKGTITINLVFTVPSGAMKYKWYTNLSSHPETVNYNSGVVEK